MVLLYYGVFEMEKCALEKEGFLADYYPGTKSPEKAIIAVGGAACDEKTSIAMSRYLIRAGYNVLVLGFYLWKGLGKDLVKIPVDYVEKAVLWLKNEKHISRIAMTGASTGAGYTLLAASLIPEISCAIPIVPWDYVCEGTTKRGSSGHSQYIWHGQEIPYTEVGSLAKMGITGWLSRSRKAPGYGMTRFMRYGYDLMEKQLNPDSRIKIENMKADVLFLAVKDDDCWPSDVAVPRMISLLTNKNYPYRVEYHIYEKASHALTDGISSMHGFAKWAVHHMLTAEKKYPKECEEARQDSFGRILNFLEEW